MITPTKLGLVIPRHHAWSPLDQAAWITATRPGGIFDSRGALSRQSATMLPVLEAAYGRWLGFLSVHQPGRPIESGLDHFEADFVRAFYKFLNAALAPCSVCAYLTSLLTVVRAMAPNQSFNALHNAVRHIWRVAEPVIDKHARIAPARDLYALGFDLMGTAPSRSTALKESGQYRDGLMIALLIAAPVRLGNFASIEIGRHLLQPDDGFRLVFPPDEVKNNRPLEHRLPTALTDPMETYLSVYRPRLLERRGRHWRGDVGNALWISEHGTHMRRSCIRDRIKWRTEARFGFSINPHCFRDCAATSIATEIPEHVGIIQPVLGHANVATGERFYNQAQSVNAARRFQAAIDSLREGR